MSEERYQTAPMRLLGVVYVVIVAAFLTLTVAIYRDAFADDVPVTLRADRTGNQMQADADVKMRGITVGRVLAVRSHGDGAELVLGMNPETLERIPRNVSARLLPKTLFGERYVNLVLPQRPEPGRLTGGDVIGQDRSATSIELERVLNDLLPLLRAVQPEKLSATLTSLSQALDGRGKPLGETLVRVGNYLGELNPQLPQLKTDISRLAAVADDYDASATDFIQAMSDFTVTSRTVVDQRDALLTLYRTLGAASTDLTSFLRVNRDNLIELAGTGRVTLELLARYAPEYACLLTAVADFKPRVDKAFGAEGKPGMSVRLNVVHDRGKYVPGKDDPRHTPVRGPGCPLPPQEVANSPEERNFVSALLAPVVGAEPAEVPAWGSLLVGPLLRGAEVTAE